MKNWSRKVFTLLTIFTIGVVYGVFIIKYQIFPHSVLASAKQRIYSIQNKNKSYTQSQVDSFYKLLEKAVVVKPSNLDSVRLVVREIVFGDTSLTKQLPASIVSVTNDNYSELENLKKIEKFTINLPLGFLSIGYIFHPQKTNNRLMIYHQGHDGDILVGKKNIAFFLSEGYTVYAFSMPLEGMNNRPKVTLNHYGIIEFGSSHDYFKFLTNPLSYFITPVVAMINYAKKYRFSNISIVGFSGGGWTATLVAALDPRVNYSFPVAATYPLGFKFIRPEKNYGDFEQTYPPLFNKVDYLDLYVLGAVGKNRSQLQILNLKDPCCFDGYEYKLYVDFLSSFIKTFGFGKFGVYSDATNIEHSISDSALTLISSEINLRSIKN
jgi:hypothetical protein